MNPEMQKQMAAMLGSGMANKAANTLIQSLKYKDYAMMAQENGAQPMTQNDPNWMQHYQQLMQQMNHGAPQGLLSQGP